MHPLWFVVGLLLAIPAGAAPGNGLRGDYFDDPGFTELRLTRTDATVNFSWDVGSPDPLIEADTLAVRWTGQIIPRYSETYTFHTVSDDGVRLAVDGLIIIDNWTDHPPTEDSGSIGLLAGQAYDITLEYYENGGGAAIQLLWSSPRQARQVIPQSQLFAGPAGLGNQPNPWSVGGFRFESRDAFGSTLPRNTVVSRSGAVGLDVPHTLQVFPQFDCRTIHVDVRQTSGLVTFEAIGALGTVLSRQELVGVGTGIQRVTLRGYRERIHSVRIVSANALCLIETVCCERAVPFSINLPVKP